jgi:hypothetical protein
MFKGAILRTLEEVCGLITVAACRKKSEWLDHRLWNGECGY